MLARRIFVATLIREIEFDPDKDAINRRKHGLSLADAARMDIEAAALVPNECYAYGEARFRAYGWIDERLHKLAFTMRRRAASDLFQKSQFERGETPWLTRIRT